MSLVAQVSAQEIALLLAPIDPEAPAGLFDVEDETYQAIDQEMVKLGGLQEASIDWSYIEEASRQYLSQQCKHLRIVGHLSVAWLRSGCWERWGFTLELLAGMVERYWESAHPKPGPKGFLAKRKWVGLVTGRLAEALPRLDRFTYTPAHAAAAQRALTRLQQQADTAQLDSAALGELERSLLAQVTLANGSVQACTAKTATPKAESAPLVDAFAPAKTSISLGNERETRRAVLSMAEFINQQDPYDPTGYQLRRFGLWAHIQAAPMARHEHRTELMAVPADIALGYEEAITGTAIDPALLLRIEKSVTASPYWIRGSFLAATVATRLAMGEVAEAIRSTCARFVQRLPALQQLRFSDGTAFVDDQSLAWLAGGQAQAGQGAPSQAFGGLREELFSQLESGGVEPVLLRLQGMQADFRAPRERCHSTVIAADLLAARGLSWLAQDLCASVARTMQQTTADAWEPEVFQRLQQYSAASVLIDQDKD
ncbi:type VI secretion system protein TssA [Pseudomonas sp. S 311-6]|uniref:type VI secretion system protein TssA n=1 Tax=Pseudomonas TaxID=286 RepID=UPI0020982281|nr:MULTISPECIES: type VI secretion system protein TssA [Pseudomonas]MCO7567098.1 type VI secretion system protein TssA [Pseudomonas mosselii]MCO7618657.1 type VI secretion system protein TssA [Pseudomonas guariconensis]MCO7637674.1 type VI secretion system protein TssA [Pseudomonas sp. S 311-6]